MRQEKEAPLAGGARANVWAPHVTQYSGEPQMLLPKGWGADSEFTGFIDTALLADRVVLTVFLPEGYDGTKGDLKFSVRLSASRRRDVVVSMRRLKRTGALAKWLARLGGAPMPPDEFSRLEGAVNDALTQARQAAADREPYQRAQWIRYRASMSSLGGPDV